MAYTVSLTPAARRAFRKLPSHEKPRIRTCMERLGDDPRPHGCEKLQGHASYLRVRVGDYRIIYEVHDAHLVVLVVMMGKRRDIYERLDHL